MSAVGTLICLLGCAKASEPTPSLFGGLPEAEETRYRGSSIKAKARSMTVTKLLSTGLIAIAMLTTSAVARENFAAPRRVIVIHGTPYYMGRPIGHWIIWNGIPVWFGPSIRGVPGHICAFGNNGMIC